MLNSEIHNPKTLPPLNNTGEACLSGFAIRKMPMLATQRTHGQVLTCEIRVKTAYHPKSPYMDDDKAATTADTLELLMLNQIAIRAALEEVSLWISQRGSTDTHDNVLGALETLDRSAEAILAGMIIDVQKEGQQPLRAA